MQADKKAEHAKRDNARRKLRHASMAAAEKQLQKKWQAKKPK